MTPTTAQLADLLCRFPRQEVFKLIENVTDAEKKILACDVSELQPRRKPNNLFRMSRGTGVCGYFDSEFPELLREIPDPPLVLFYRGSLTGLAAKCVGIVGARRCTRVGAETARQLAGELAEHQITIVSGLALGIDGAAHRGALSAGGQTIAFLGAGVDVVYPRSHARMAEEIIDCGGALVSEYPSGTTPRPYHFPERNRLISGAVHAAVVIEAGDKSGSLITARMALEQGRDVFAVPGPVTSLLSVGCHRLIRQGAGLVTGAGDVLEELGWQRSGPRARAQTELSDPARSVLEALGPYPQSLDELLLTLDRGELTVARLTELLVELELAGFVADSPLGYIRTS